MDSFKAAEVSRMEKGGNARWRGEWEGKTGYVCLLFLPPFSMTIYNIWHWNTSVRGGFAEM